MVGKLKVRVHEILEKDIDGDRVSRGFDIFIISLITLNVFAVIMETVKGLYLPYQQYFDAFELFSITIFSAEYLGRVLTITSDEKYKHPIYGRLKYIFSGPALIDLIAILPFYAAAMFMMDGRMIRIIRLMRIFRILKFKRYSQTMQLIADVFYKKREGLVISLVMTLMLLLVSSSLMYYVENGAQPDKFSSIPATMWWGVATLTTVGYGDIYPITAAGKLLGSVMAILGIGVFALPAGILASGFGQMFKENDKVKPD